MTDIFEFFFPSEVIVVIYGLESALEFVTALVFAPVGLDTLSWL